MWKVTLNQNTLFYTTITRKSKILKNPLFSRDLTSFNYSWQARQLWNSKEAFVPLTHNDMFFFLQTRPTRLAVGLTRLLTKCLTLNLIQHRISLLSSSNQTIIRMFCCAWINIVEKHFDIMASIIYKLCACRLKSVHLHETLFKCPSNGIPILLEMEIK